MKKNFLFTLILTPIITILSFSILSGCNPATIAQGSPSVVPPTQVLQSATASVTDSTSSGSYTPFTLKTMDFDVTYTHVPQRVVSLNLHTTENLIALGLEGVIIGTAYTNAEVLPEYKDKFDKIPKLADKYPSWEVLLNAQPDFVFGRNSAFGEKGVANISKFLENDIMVYVAKETYTPGSSIEATYEDFQNLGKIFAVETKADVLIANMREKVKLVTDKTAKIEEKLRVFVYDSGTDQAFTSGQSLESNLIDLAGGVNIFNDIEKTWSNASWEEIIKRNPEVIVINDYAPTSAQEKIDFLKGKKELSEVDAIKNNRFVVLPLPSIFTGIRNADAVEFLAKGFYPDLFK